DQALERVFHFMGLRRPQKEALEEFHKIILGLDRDLIELKSEEVSRHIKERYPHWKFGGGFAHMTFLLATGVGKTRLMGAMMAYLYLGRQTQDFLLLAPRAAVLRKLEEECRPGSGKYIFVDTALVPEPHLWTRANLQSFDPSLRQDEFQHGPNIAIFS